jgi:hypothetical protein
LLPGHLLFLERRQFSTQAGKLAAVGLAGGAGEAVTLRIITTLVLHFYKDRCGMHTTPSRPPFRKPESPHPAPPPELFAGVGWALAPPRVEVVGWLSEEDMPFPWREDIVLICDKICI